MIVPQIDLAPGVGRRPLTRRKQFEPQILAAGSPQAIPACHTILQRQERICPAEAVGFALPLIGSKTGAAVRDEREAVPLNSVGLLLIVYGIDRKCISLWNIEDQER